MKTELMRNVTVTKQVKIELTREQWELYDTITPGELAQMNMLVTEAINGSDDYSQAMEAVGVALRKFCQHGATDTEPRSLAKHICIKLFKGA